MQLDFPQDQIEAFCRSWKITEMAVFGSVLREDFCTDSDIDVLVAFDQHAHWSLFDLVTMQDQLEAILGNEVDLMTRKGVEQSHNPIRREATCGRLVLSITPHEPVPRQGLPLRCRPGCPAHHAVC